METRTEPAEIACLVNLRAPSSVGEEISKLPEVRNQAAKSAVDLVVEKAIAQDAGIHTVIILDRSSSMEVHREEMIKAVNGFLAGQQAEQAAQAALDAQSPKTPSGLVAERFSEKYNFSLVMFDHSYSMPITDQPLEKVKPLEKRDYRPSGCTALYDAIGKTIRRFKEQRRVVMVIVTDGKDNSSREFKQADIKALIEQYKDPATYGWNFIYLAADPTLLEQGGEISITREADSGSSSRHVDFRCMSDFASNTLGRAITEFRRGTTRTVTI
jgi:hypothetical protein